jgi:hypothetical protein
MNTTATTPSHETNRHESDVAATSASDAPPAAPAQTVDLSQLVKTVTALLDDAETSLGDAPPQLTATEKRRTAKLRKGGTKILLSIAPIVQQFKLDSSSLNADEMIDRLGDAEALKPLQSRLQKILKRVEDELFSAQGDAWEMGLQFYSLLKRRSRTDGEMAKSMAPLRAMFAYRHPLVKKERAKKVETRAKARLKSALTLAKKYGVPTDDAPGGPPLPDVESTPPLPTKPEESP